MAFFRKKNARSARAKMPRADGSSGLQRFQRRRNLGIYCSLRPRLGDLSYTSHSLRPPDEMYVEKSTFSGRAVEHFPVWGSGSFRNLFFLGPKCGQNCFRSIDPRSVGVSWNRSTNDTGSMSKALRALDRFERNGHESIEESRFSAFKCRFCLQRKAKC